MKTLMMTLALSVFGETATADQICSVEQDEFSFGVLTYSLPETEDPFGLSQDAVALAKINGTKLVFEGDIRIQQTRVGTITTQSFGADDVEPFTIRQTSSFIFLPCGRDSCPKPTELTHSQLSYAGQSYDLTCTAFAL